MTRTCLYCLVDRPITDYRSTNRCKFCYNKARSARYYANIEQEKARRIAYRLANPEKFKAYHKKWDAANHDKIRARGRKRYAEDGGARLKAWFLANVENPKEYYKQARGKRLDKSPESETYNGAMCYLSKLNRVPTWLTEEQLMEIRHYYSLAKELQWLSEETLHVDHIIPIKGKTVSGLHVPWNLQILPASENYKKGTKVK